MTIGKYLFERSLVYKREKRGMLTGVLHRYPTLWNTFFDEVLGLDYGEGVIITAYSDDIGFSIVVRKIEELSSTANRTMAMINEWMGDNRMSLADEKREVLIMKGTYKQEGCQNKIRLQRINRQKRD